jgi:hypothetical protein
VVRIVCIFGLCKYLPNEAVSLRVQWMHLVLCAPVNYASNGQTQTGDSYRFFEMPCDDWWIDGKSTRLTARGTAMPC